MMLYEELDVAAKTFLGENVFKSLSQGNELIIRNLGEGIRLRPYQHEAIGRYMFYMDQYKSRQYPTHLLFNMATGSGKTVIMAALILDLYKRGYRNFIFFTRLDNIVEKTKINFLKSHSSKFVFSKNILINGSNVKINEVQNFSGITGDDINILFTTTANLHYKLLEARENSITLDELGLLQIALIADEAHNLSADTQSKLSSLDELAKSSWESTISKLSNLNSGVNVLLEFTATARLDPGNPEILNKYKNKAIYRYDLKEFRLDGYSKDVNTLEVDAPVLERALVALIVSQYRLKVAQKYGLIVKPVVLFKANRVSPPKRSLEESLTDEKVVVSGEFKTRFHEFIRLLKPKDFVNYTNSIDPTLSRAFAFFRAEGMTLEELIRELQIDFAESNTLSVDDSKEIEKRQSLLNSLEEPTNHIRAIFATEKLNEGWDVLNLFDIVRLYNTRDSSKNKAGATTIQEAQLIGRGARYYPYSFGVLSPEKRKFDSDVLNDLRILEELHYHSKTNSRYITELRAVLTESGLLPDRTVTRRVEVKNSFKSSEIWNTGMIYVNMREENLSGGLFSESESAADLNLISVEAVFALPTRRMRETSIFGDREEIQESETVEIRKIMIQDLGLSTLRTALWDLPRFSFSTLHDFFPNVKSVASFLSDEQYLRDCFIHVSGLASQLDSLDSSEKRKIARFFFEQIFLYSDAAPLYRGSLTFSPKPLKEVFGLAKELKLDGDSERSKQVSSMELSLESWFAQNEIWGTSEEKALINFIKNSISELEVTFDEIALFRNEMHFSLFSFKDGTPFYPDFVLLLLSRKDKMQIGYQVFIEPKGDQFLDDNGAFEHSKEGWKEKFLKEISVKHKLMAENEHYRLVGLPFYNKGLSSTLEKSEFSKAFSELLTLS